MGCLGLGLGTLSLNPKPDFPFEGPGARTDIEDARLACNSPLGTNGVQGLGFRIKP